MHPALLPAQPGRLSGQQHPVAGAYLRSPCISRVMPLIAALKSSALLSWLAFFSVSPKALRTAFATGKPDSRIDFRQQHCSTIDTLHLRRRAPAPLTDDLALLTGPYPPPARYNNSRPILHAPAHL